MFKRNKRQKTLEGTIKYFIVQVFSSLLLLYSIFTNNWRLLILPLLIKISSAPFHLWFIPCLKNLEWNRIFILLTWQKLVPTLILTILQFSSLLIITLTLINSSVGSLIGITQIKIKKILGYSSIYHISWLLLLLKSYKYIIVLYLTIYRVLNYRLIKIFKKIKIERIFKALTSNNINLTLILLNIISLRGLPPFLGFFLKWYIMISLLKTPLILIILSLLLLSIINLYFYFQFIIISFTLKRTTKNIKKYPFIIRTFFRTLILLLFWC